MDYHGNVNPDLLARMPVQARQVLEIGCGNAALGRAWLPRAPGARYVGVELVPAVAEEAAKALDSVVVGDVETPAVFAQVQALRPPNGYDLLVCGDVLEHMRDPWQVLRSLRDLMAPGGACVACIPNVRHWSVLVDLLHGRFPYADAGLLDRTHLRFFTLESAVALFQAAGWRVLDAKARVFPGPRMDAALAALVPLAQTIGRDPEAMRRDLTALQWVIRAAAPTPEPGA